MGGTAEGGPFSSAGASSLSRSNGPTQLPKSGGADGSGGPVNPLAPLSLLAAAAIIAGRALPRLINR
jgi:hypothetical protein